MTKKKAEETATVFSIQTWTSLILIEVIEWISSTRCYHFLYVLFCVCLHFPSFEIRLIIPTHLPPYKTTSPIIWLILTQVCILN